MKMPTIVGIFIFISRENFMFSRVKHEKSFITLGPERFCTILQKETTFLDRKLTPAYIKLLKMGPTVKANSNALAYVTRPLIG